MASSPRPLDCLLVHVPRLVADDPLFGPHSRVNFPAAGLLSMAEELDARGRSCRILNLGAAKARNPRFSLLAYLRRHRVRVAAFSLHWHPQAFDTLDAVRQVKALMPDLFVVLGGYTAGYFAREILEHHPGVDGVIRGEGEDALARVLDVVIDGAGPGLAAVPNLVWRRGDGGIESNEVLLWSTSADLDRWSFSRFDLLEDADTALRLKWIHPWEKGPAWLVRHNRRLATKTLFGVPVGRGCPGTCTWCAGSWPTVQAATGRRKIARRAPERIAASIDEIRREHGVERFYLCFDPTPGREAYSRELFAALDRLSPKVRLDFEAFGLPSRDLIRTFRRSLHWDSALLLSPETPDEELRRRHRSFPFTNEELEDRLALLSELRLPTKLYFTLGLPGQGPEDLVATHVFVRRLQHRYRAIRSVHVFPIEMEPGAPWFEDPERYGIRLRRRTLADFVAASRRPDLTLGYDTDALSEAELLDGYRRWFRPVGLRRTAIRVLRWKLRVALFDRLGARLAAVRRHDGP